MHQTRLEFQNRNFETGNLFQTGSPFQYLNMVDLVCPKAAYQPIIVTILETFIFLNWPYLICQLTKNSHRNHALDCTLGPHQNGVLDLTGDILCLMVICKEYDNTKIRKSLFEEKITRQTLFQNFIKHGIKCDFFPLKNFFT